MSSNQQRHIPWLEPSQWQQLELSFASFIKNGIECAEANNLAASIKEKLESVDAALSFLCSLTCSSCSDNCCVRATVWYDFRDLIYFHCSHGKIPEKQISKKNDLSCKLLNSEGCALIRSKRPFICTWYLCSSHKDLLRRLQQSGKIDRDVEGILSDIQSDRKMLENVFVECVAGFPRI